MKTLILIHPPPLRHWHSGCRRITARLPFPAPPALRSSHRFSPRFHFSSSSFFFRPLYSSFALRLASFRAQTREIGRDTGSHGGSVAIRLNMNAGVSGFQNAIVTKGIVVTSGLLSLVLAARLDVNQYSLSYQKVVQRLELWRLVIAPMAFPSIPELLVGLYLLYFFRVFERRVGSTKYMFFVIFTTVITTFLEIVFLFILKDLASFSNIRLRSGPFGLIFSSFVLFFFDIPVSTRIKLLGAEVSEKSFVYFVGLQLLLWSWMQSFIPGLCGVISGLLYRYDVAGVQEIGFSLGAFRQMAWRVAPFFSGISPEMASRMNFSRTREPETRRDNQHENGVHAVAPTAPVTEEKVAKLVVLGHNQNDAVVALTRCCNDVAAAKDYLRNREILGRRPDY